MKWAQTQPKSLTLYLPERLGQWDSATGFFGPEPTGFGGDAYTVNSGLLDIEPGAGFGFNAMILGKNSGDLRLISVSDRRLTAYRPIADGLLGADSKTSWTLQFGQFEQRYGATFSVANSQPKLPQIKMDSVEAQAFVKRDPDRGVIYELTVATTPAVRVLDASVTNASQGDLTMTKQGSLVRARIVDRTGVVLADQTY
jgi:hypothetical protein